MPTMPSFGRVSHRHLLIAGNLVKHSFSVLVQDRITLTVQAMNPLNRPPTPSTTTNPLNALQTPPSAGHRHQHKARRIRKLATLRQETPLNGVAAILNTTTVLFQAASGIRPLCLSTITPSLKRTVSPPHTRSMFLRP